MAATLSFENYPPARYAALQSALLQKGLEIDGNVGTIKKFGADVSYGYDGTSTLMLLVRSAPHFHSFDGFVKKLSAAIGGVTV